MWKTNSCCLIALLVLSFSCQNKEIQKQEEKTESNFNPKGHWIVRTAAHFCFATTSYKEDGGEKQASRMFLCNKIPFEGPQGPKEIDVGFDPDRSTLSITEAKTIRKIQLDKARFGEAAIPLGQEIRTLTKGCKALSETRNGASFLKDSMAKRLNIPPREISKTMAYIRTTTVSFIPENEDPEGCQRYLQKLGEDLRQGRKSDPLYPFLIQVKALDLERMEDLKSASLIYMYDAQRL